MPAEVGLGVPIAAANADRIPEVVSEFPGKIASDVKNLTENPSVSNVANVVEDAAAVYSGVKLVQAGARSVASTVRNAGAANEAATLGAATTEVGTSAESAPVVIGETMARVEQAAAKIPGSKILNDMPDFKAMGMNADQVTSSMMQYNRKWILEQMRSGRPIFDIGLDPNRATRSIFYEMEQNMLKNYKKLHPEFNGVTTP
jgi:hypothetical protein